jgi:hypothetical protein
MLVHNQLGTLVLLTTNQIMKCTAEGRTTLLVASLSNMHPMEWAERSHAQSLLVFDADKERSRWKQNSTFPSCLSYRAALEVTETSYTRVLIEGRWNRMS